MESSTKAGRPKVVYPVIILVTWILVSGNVSALDLDHVLQQVKVEPPNRVAFREERFNALLAEPLVLTGFLEYPEPGHLVKTVETPFSESMQFEGDQVEITQDGKKRRLSLKNRKPLLVMLQSIESILSGRADLLLQNFDAVLTGSGQDWQLKLVPRSDNLARHLESLTVKGNDETVDSILFRMDSGDWQRLEILPSPSGS
jgi:hypothetical protein